MEYLGSWTDRFSGMRIKKLTINFHQVWFRPGFRESAFQPFKKETTSQDDEKTEEYDSEVDEMVDIEKIEDKEEDNGNSTASVSSANWVTTNSIEIGLMAFCNYI